MGIHRLLAWTTTMYVVEQMIVFDDDVVECKQVPPMCEPSMSAFALSLDDRLLSYSC
jgi:hypothetical protein